MLRRALLVALGRRFIDNRRCRREWQSQRSQAGGIPTRSRIYEGLGDGIEPGWALSSKPGIYEVYLGVSHSGIEPTMEPEARETLGAHADAITAAHVLIENSPFQKPAQLLHRLVVARCESVMARSVPCFLFLS